MQWTSNQAVYRHFPECPELTEKVKHDNANNKVRLPNIQVFLCIQWWFSVIFSKNVASTTNNIAHKGQGLIININRSRDYIVRRTHRNEDSIFKENSQDDF